MFELGQVVATANFENTLGKEASIKEAQKSLVRHARCDWGDCCDEDKKSNDDALKAGERLLSVYHTDDGIKFWIITERDRSVTTILLPEDY
jgi:hypothetical protein